MIRIRKARLRLLFAVVAAVLLVLAAPSTATSQQDAGADLAQFYGDLFGPGSGPVFSMNTAPNLYDNFTNGPTELDGFAITAIGGARFDAEMLNPDPLLALRAYGIEPGAVEFEPPTTPSGVGPDVIIGLMQADLADATAAALAELAAYAFDPDAPTPAPGSLFNGAILSNTEMPDGFGDEYRSIVDSIELPTPGFELDRYFDPDGPFGCGARTAPGGTNYEVMCTADDQGGSQFAMQWELYGMSLSDSLESMGTEAEVVWGFRTTDEPIFMGAVAGDFFNYTNQNWSLRLADGAFAITRFGFNATANAWSEVPTQARIIVGGTVGSTYSLLVPYGEAMPPIDGVRFNTFKAVGPRGPGTVVSDAQPALSDTLIDFDLFNTLTLTSDFALVSLGDAALSELAALAQPDPTATTAPTPEPTVAPAEEPTAAPVEEPTAAPVEEATTTTPQPESTGGDGLNWGWVAIGAGLLLLAGAAYLFFVDKKGDCEELRKLWLAAKANADAAETAATQLEAECDALEDEVGNLEDELDSQCEAWPPACRDDYAEEAGDESTRVTTFDLAARDAWARQRWGQYQDGEISAEEAGGAREETPPDDFVEQMRQHDTDEKAKRTRNQESLEAKRTEAATKCAEAATARTEADADAVKAAEAEAKYLECIGKVVEAAARQAEADRIAQEQLAQASGANGLSTTTRPPPETGSPCDGEPDVRTQTARLKKQILLSSEFGVVQQQQRLLGEDERKQIARELHDIEDDLSGLGSLLSAGSLGSSLATGQLGQAGADAVTGGLDIPTNLAQGIASLMTNIAKVVAAAADFANAVDARNSLYDIVFKTSTRFVTVTVFEVRYCEQGVWKCRTELEIDRGRIINQDRTKTDFDRRTAQTESRRATWTLRRLERGTQEILDFIEANRPGPC